MLKHLTTYGIFNDSFSVVPGKACPKPDSQQTRSINMTIFNKTNRLFLSALMFIVAPVSFGQTQPLLQDIKVFPAAASTPSNSVPLVKKTGSSTAIAAKGEIRTMFPALSMVDIPGNSGVLVETMDGNVVMESNATSTFNPASNVKVATSYAVLRTFGPDYRFQTSVYTDGAIDRATGTLNGNLYISGRDPVFGYEHGVSIANELNRLGVTTVRGDLIVTDNFAMNYSSSAQRSAEVLYTDLDQAKRPTAAVKAWSNYLVNSAQVGRVSGAPGVSISGSVYVQPIPSSLQLLFVHESAPIRDIIKATMCYSNNFLAERLGDMLGGPYAVARVVQLNADIPVNEFSIQTSSGLGYNRVTPNAMMKLLRALRSDLARYKMTYADIMPVAGIDRGTLEGRFDNDFSKGSVVGKTGTLGVTDSGVSALSGELNTKNGRFLFVIFNQHGGVARFRNFQNYFVSLVQAQFGGPAPILYDAVSLDARLARSRISYPAMQNGRAE